MNPYLITILTVYLIANIIILIREGVPDSQPGDEQAYVIVMLIIGTPVFIAFSLKELMRSRTKAVA